MDVSKVGDFARAESIKYGVPEDGYFFDRVKNAAQSKVELEKIAPSVEENLPDIYKEMYGVKPEDAAEEMLSRDDLKKSLGIAKLDANFSLQMKQLNKDIERSSGEQMDKISQERYGMPVEEYATQIGKEYNNSQSQLEAKYAPLINEGGQFIGTQEEYSAYKQETEELNKSYETIFGDFVSQNMRDVASINNKANRRFRRQQDELFAAYKTEYADKAKGINPLLQERHQKAYGKALEKAMKAEGVRKETKAMIEGGPFGTNFAANLGISGFASGAAGQMKSIIKSMGMEGGKDYSGIPLSDLWGGFVDPEWWEQKSIDFAIGDTEIKGWSDILNPKKILKSTSFTLGGMAPMLAASIPAGMVTGGLGGGAMLTTLASGAAGWGVETMSITQDAYDQKFKETGSASKADEAADKSFKGQVYLMPMYALEMVPFFGDVASKLGKVGMDNMAARFIVGGTVETVAEMGQEYPQQLFEQAIVDDKQLSDAFEYASVEGFEKTIMNVAPTTMLLGGGGASLDTKTSKEDMAKSLAMRVNIGNLTESAMEQKMLKMTVNAGEKFSKAFVATQLMEGNITEEQATTATLAIESSVSTIKKGKEYNLDNKNNYILATLDLKLKAAKAKAEAESDPMMKGIAERKVKNIEKQSQQLMEQGNADVAVVTYPDGDFDVLTHDEARLAMSKDEFMKSFASGDLKVEAMGNGQSKLMSELEEKSKPFAPKEVKDDTKTTEQEPVGTEEQGREEDPGQVQEPEVSEEEGDADSVLQEQKEVDAENKKIDEEEKRIDKEIEYLDIQIENFEEEISNSNSDYKSDVAEIKEKFKQKIADVKKKKVSKAKQAELIEDLKEEQAAELEDRKDDRDGEIEGYRDDIKQEKADKRKALNEKKKLEASRPKIKEAPKSKKKAKEPSKKEEVKEPAKEKEETVSTTEEELSSIEQELEKQKGGIFSEKRKRKKLVKAVRNGIKAISKALPNVKIKLHKNNQEFVDAGVTGERKEGYDLSAGIYDPET